jgi:fucose 4-O-acetylase-like acetyltransferase
MWMVFCFFRLSASWLQRIHLSKPLQYVGTRTLDIYLLHYFFLPRFLLPYAGLLQNYNNSAIEFLVILSIALLVLGVTLLASYVIRLNHFLGHYLFGVN